MRPEQLPLLRQVSAPSVHPDGTWAVVSVVRPDFDADAYTGQLWRIPLNRRDGVPRRITRGFCDTEPVVSPDGRMIAFVRAEQGSVGQVAVVDSHGGEPMVITDAKRGVGSLAWSPDSTRIAYTTRIPEEGRYGTLEGVSATQEDPRHITKIGFHSNGLGYTADQRRQVFVVNVPSLDDEPRVKPVGRAAKDRKEVSLVPEPVRVCEVDADLDDPAFSADGRWVYVVGALHETADTDLVSDLYRVPAKGGAPERVTTSDLSVEQVIVSGKEVYLLGAEVGESRRDFVGQNPGIYLSAAKGRRPRRLTDAESLAIQDAVACEGGVLAIEEHRGTSRLHRITPGSDEILLDKVVIQGAAAVPGSARVVVSVSTPTSPGEVWVVDGGKKTVLTDFAAELRAATTIVPAKALTARSVDGYPVHGWVLLPEGKGPHPVLLCIHGGPFASYHATFFDEFQTYVEAGYAVVACNPRGSAGYGEAHGKAIKGDMGNLDYRDIMSFLDHALAKVDGLDASRVGVMGGSYGGYMTAWIIAHEQRFRGAIVERGFLDAATFTGASDIGWFFQHEYNGTDRAVMDAQSPMTYVDRVSTPTLVIHSEQDLRCPISQGYRYYTELKLRGVEAELLAFPGENHELSRSGTPWHRRQRFEAILAWWKRWL